jgi:glucose 1-dehydrogenase
MADLSGHVAIISGGLGDIGRAIALTLARGGADIALGDLLPAAEAQGLISQIEKVGRRCRYAKVDVSDAEAVHAWVGDIEANLGTPDLVIVNAAIVVLADFQHTRAADWQRVQRVNLDGAFFQSQSCALRLIALKKPGRIVFIGSWAAQIPHTHIPSYCASKAGMRMLCQCVAAELAPYGILANEVAPGFVDAGLSGKCFEKNPADRERAIAQVPIHKLSSVEDVALQVEHLCDPRNQHMTGSVVLMDGGLSLRARNDAGAQG